MVICRNGVRKGWIGSVDVLNCVEIWFGVVFGMLYGRCRKGGL